MASSATCGPWESCSTSCFQVHDGTYGRPRPHCPTGRPLASLLPHMPCAPCLRIPGAPPFHGRTFDPLQPGCLDLERHPWPLISEAAKGRWSVVCILLAFLCAHRVRQAAHHPCPLQFVSRCLFGSPVPHAASPMPAQPSLPRLRPCADVVRRLLQPNPAQRVTTSELLQHPWLAAEGAAPEHPMDSVIIARMRKLHVGKKVKKAAILAAAQHLRCPAACQPDACRRGPAWEARALFPPLPPCTLCHSAHPCIPALFLSLSSRPLALCLLHRRSFEEIHGVRELCKAYDTDSEPGMRAGGRLPLLPLQGVAVLLLV